MRWVHGSMNTEASSSGLVEHHHPRGLCFSSQKEVGVGEVAVGAGMKGPPNGEMAR
jgi:hypothetical protein